MRRAGSVCWDLGTSVKRTKNKLRDYMAKLRDYMASRDPSIAMPGSQLAGLRFFHAIAKLIFSVFHKRAEILANLASPPHVIGP